MYVQEQSIGLPMVTEFNLINFLQRLYDQGGCGYSAINTASSAVCYVMSILGMPLSTTALLTKYKKGIFNARPSLPRYVNTWDPDIVLQYYEKNDNNYNMLFMASKVATLLALASCVRVATLHSINMSDVVTRNDKIVLNITQLQKQSRPGYHLKPIELGDYPNKKQCIKAAIEKYIRITENIRSQHSSITSLFITSTKPYKNASKDTIARWIKNTIHKAGVPEHFTAHSTRSAATSSLARKGTDITTILTKAGWSSSNTFNKFYKRL